MLSICTNISKRYFIIIGFNLLKYLFTPKFHKWVFNYKIWFPYPVNGGQFKKLTNFKMSKRNSYWLKVNARLGQLTAACTSPIKLRLVL